MGAHRKLTEKSALCALNLLGAGMNNISQHGGRAGKETGEPIKIVQEAMKQDKVVIFLDAKGAYDHMDRGMTYITMAMKAVYTNWLTD